MNRRKHLKYLDSRLRGNDGKSLGKVGTHFSHGWMTVVSPPASKVLGSTLVL